MSERLRKALGGDRDNLERALRDAHDELLPLKRQVQELELLMARARGILDLADTWIPWPPLPGPSRPITLHVAMVRVLENSANRWMRPRDIARQIAREGLYRRRDGLPPTTRDVSARASTYVGLFRRSDLYIRLRMDPPGARIRRQGRDPQPQR